MLEDDGYGKLGFYSNAAIYLGLAVGSIISTAVLNKIGDIWSMALGGFMCVPFMSSFILASIKSENPDLDNFCFKPGFVYTFMITLSFVNGLGEAIMWVA